MSTIYLFSNKTTNGNGDAYGYPGGPRLLIIRGTMDSATVKMQASDDGTNFVDINDASFSANGATMFMLPVSAVIRAVLSNAGAATSVTVAMV